MRLKLTHERGGPPFKPYVRITRTRLTDGLSACDIMLPPRRVRFHDLRHTCASHLVMGTWGRQWTVNEVSAFIGHSDISVTQRYAHLSVDHLAVAAAETTGDVQAPKETTLATRRSARVQRSRQRRGQSVLAAPVARSLGENQVDAVQAIEGHAKDTRRTNRVLGSFDLKDTSTVMSHFTYPNDDENLQDKTSVADQSPANTRLESTVSPVSPAKVQVEAGAGYRSRTGDNQLGKQSHSASNYA